jgi:hypothetical protein
MRRAWLRESDERAFAAVVIWPILGHSGDARTAKLAFDPGTACGYSTHALAHATLACETVTGSPTINSLSRGCSNRVVTTTSPSGSETIGAHDLAASDGPKCLPYSYVD